MNFSNKVVLITGSGSGIGRATAVSFAQGGAKVVVNDLIPERGEETLDLVKKKGSEGVFIECDISVAADAERMIKEIIKVFGKIDILVNNAGIIVPGRVDNIAEEDIDRALKVNVKGVFLVSKYAVLEMKKAGGGVIVNIASVAALKGIADRSAYSASKGAVLALTRAMATDYIKDNIRVNCVCPGTTYTPALEERMRALPDPEAARVAFIARQPMGRLGKEEEIAQAILFAACDEASYMNGSIISIDGGALL